jgi:hypothetical protein
LANVFIASVFKILAVQLLVRFPSRIQWSRGAFEETPARELCTVNLEQAERIAALRDRYQVQFELRMSAATSVNNYEYLDILDRGRRDTGMSRPAGGVLCDIGCASFWYAATLQIFFRSDRMVELPRGFPF